MKEKLGVVFVPVCIILMLISNILFFNVVDYFDLSSILVAGTLFLIISWCADLYIRDYITDVRHKQKLVSTFITCLLFVILMIVSYFIYNNILNNLNIIQTIIKSLNIKFLIRFV